jgi:tetraacyldisaccharide 4'-kinase
LVTGIANAKPLDEFLNSKNLNFEHLNYKDHHEFSEKDIKKIKSKGLIITTEKDYMRLSPYFQNSNQIFYLPIETTISNHKGFDELIGNFVSSF